MLPGFDETLELDEALETNADIELHAQLRELRDDGVDEEGAVEASFHDDTWQSGTTLLDAVQDEVAGALGVVDIARAVKNIEDLASAERTREEVLLTSIERDSLEFATFCGRTRQGEDRSRIVQAALELLRVTVQTLGRSSRE